MNVIICVVQYGEEKERKEKSKNFGGWNFMLWKFLSHTHSGEWGLWVAELLGEWGQATSLLFPWPWRLL